MKNAFLCIYLLLVPALACAQGKASNPAQFAQDYFNAWKATQSPTATKADIEYYLSLLVDDVGHQHLPYDPNAARHAQGKQNMREGMTYYLNAHTEYKAELSKVMVGFNVVVIQYRTDSRGKHPQTGQWVEQSNDTIEVLELEANKVAVIRKYSE